MRLTQKNEKFCLLGLLLSFGLALTACSSGVTLQSKVNTPPSKPH